MKQTCKTFIALVTVIVMLTGLVPLNVAAAADPSLIFEMDLSSYTNGDVSTIANSVSGGNSTITAGGSGVPELRQTTEGVSYLAFRRSDRTENLTGTSVKVVDSDIAAADALTVEAWVRAEGYNLSNKSGRIFGLGNDSNHFADVMIGVANNVYYKATGQVNTGQLGDAYQTLWQGDMGAYDEEWVHYVITREWVAGENGAGTWNIAIYINGGEKKVSAAYSVASRADESDKFLMIGAHKGGTAALWGDIADFRVYNEAADETKATELYNATVNNFHPGTYVPDTPDPDTPDPDTPDTPDPDTPDPDTPDTPDPDTPDPDTPDTPDPDTPDTPEEPDGILIIEEDMSMYTAGTSPTETEMFVKTCKEEDNFSNLKVLETTGSTSGETINYFQLKTDVYGSLNSYYGYKFPTAATEDLVLDINLSVNGTPESRGLRCGEDTIIHNLRSAPSATKDEFGFYNLRYTFIKNTNGKYVVTCYDLLDNNKVVMTTTTSLSTIAGLYCQQYVSRGNENTSMYMDISKYKLFRYLEPEVAETNGDTLKRVDDELIVTFSQKIDEQTLGNLSIKCGDDTVVTTNKEYDASSNTLTVSLIEYLDYDKEYKICIGGIKNKYGIAAAEDAYRAFTLPDREIEANSVVFKDSQGGVIDALGTNADISATVELSSDLLSGANARVFLLLYDESGIVRDAAMAGESAVGSQAAPFTARLSGGVTPKTGYKAKCFVWQLKDGINVPVKSAELK